MSPKNVVMAAALALLLAGCQTTDPDLKPRGTVSKAHTPLNEAMMDKYFTEAADNAIIRQHTIYPYHFVANSDRFNAVGAREVHVLAMHYAEYPGELNVHRGDAGDALYNARVEAVSQAMTRAGVDMNRIEVADGLPGGDGLVSNRVIVIMEQWTAGADSQRQSSQRGQPDRRRDPQRDSQRTGNQTETIGGDNE